MRYPCRPLISTWMVSPVAGSPLCCHRLWLVAVECLSLRWRRPALWPAVRVWVVVFGINATDVVYFDAPFPAHLFAFIRLSYWAWKYLLFSCYTTFGSPFVSTTFEAFVWRIEIKRLSLTKEMAASLSETSAFTPSVRLRRLFFLFLSRHGRNSFHRS